MRTKLILIAMAGLVSFTSITRDATAIRRNTIEGKKELAINRQGADYYFSSAENKDAFLKSPGAYERQYGGWCAYGMGKNGDKVNEDPETFKIIDGKLFLFYNRFFNNTLTSWNKDETNLKTKAEINWQKIVH